MNINEFHVTQDHLFMKKDLQPQEHARLVGVTLRGCSLVRATLLLVSAV